MIHDDDHLTTADDYIDSTQSEFATTTHYVNVGSFLVRNTTSVPEAGSLALFALGLMLLSLLRHKPG